MLHLLEVPQHVWKHTHKELQIMEEYIHRHTQVAAHMAELMVRLTPSRVAVGCFCSTAVMYRYRHALITNAGKGC